MGLPWNQRLRELDTLQQQHERQQHEDEAQLDETARKRIIDLARDFPRVWNDARTSALERKRMLALLIDDVTLVAGPSIAVHVRWRGVSVRDTPSLDGQARLDCQMSSTRLRAP